MLNRPLPAPARDIALLIGRVVLGVVLFAHGWQKLMINGIAGTYGQFEKLGIPLAIVSASFTSFVEFVGGVLLVIGALTTTVVALDLVVMVGAAGFVHMTHGIFAQNGGWELVGVIVAAELALAATGPGRFSVDHLISLRRAREDEEQKRTQTPVHRAPASTGGTFATAVRHAPGRAPRHVGVAAQFARLAPYQAGPAVSQHVDSQQPVRACPATQAATRPTVTQAVAAQNAVVRQPAPSQAGASPVDPHRVIDAPAHTERFQQVPPVERPEMTDPAVVADRVGSARPAEPARSVQPAGSVEPARSAEAAGPGAVSPAEVSPAEVSPGEVAQPDGARPADTGEPVEAVSLFEPRHPFEAQESFEPQPRDARQPIDAPQLVDAQHPVEAGVRPGGHQPAAGPRPSYLPRPFEMPEPVGTQRHEGLPQRVRRAERVGIAVTPVQ